jgi:hypothetical protein
VTQTSVPNQQFVVPFIVDSPLPQTASGAAPPVQQDQAPPQQQQLPPPPNPLAPSDPTKTDDPALDSILQGQQGQQSPASVQADLQKLGKVFGVDVSQFKNPDDARQALRILSERYIQHGLNSNVPPPHQQAPLQQRQQAPPPQQRQTQQRTEDEFDYNGVDPIVANKLRALEAEVAASREEAAIFRQQSEAAAAAQFQNARAEIRNRANRALDSLQSATFGVGNQQNLQQQFARRSFLDMTEKMIIGMAESNTLNSTIEDIVLSMAYLTNGAQAPQQQQQPQQQLPQQSQNLFYQQQYVDPASQYGTQPPVSFQPQYPYGPGQAAPAQVPQQFPVSPQYQQVPPHQRVRDEAEKMKQDPHFLAGARAILSRAR